MTKINKKLKFILSITIFMIILSLAMGNIVLSAQVELPWLYSFETLLFDTKSGWIEQGQYAIGEHGNEYYVCEKDEQCDVDIPLNEVDMTYDVSHLKKVNLIGKQYFDVFRDLDGSKLRVKADSDKYWRLFDTSGYPSPSKNKISFPLLLGKSAEAAITYGGNPTTNPEQTNTSSFSFNHTTTGSQVALVISIGTDDNTCTDPVPTSVTWDGAGISNGGVFNCESTAALISSDVWYATNAGAKTAAVGVNLTNTVLEIVAIASHYNGVDTTDAKDAGNSATGLTGNPIVTVNTNSTDTWLVDALTIDNKDSETETSSDYNQISIYDMGSEGVGASYRDVTGAAGGYAIGWTDADSVHEWSQSAIALKPYVESEPEYTPTTTAVTDFPDIVVPGQTVTFSVTWEDNNAGEQVEAKICKTSDFVDQSCVPWTNYWATSTSPTTNNPVNETYTATAGDFGSNDYYAFICDDSGLCSSWLSGSFGVGGVPKIKGDVRIKGGVRVKKY